MEAAVAEARPALLTVDEAADYLGIAPVSLYGMISRAKRSGRGVPFLKLGSGAKARVRFDREALREWAETNAGVSR